MSEDFNNYGPITSEAEPVPADKLKRNGSRPASKSDLPGINIRELYEERNWTALAGLALVGVGVLFLLQDMLGISLNLWSLAMLGIGGWLMVDAWQKYDAAGRAWVGNTRNRMLGGGLIAMVGLVSIMNLSWWGLMLLGVGGWLAYDTWQRYEANGRVWTEYTRNRMAAAGIIGFVGLFGFFHLGSAWSLILIAVGVTMLYRHFSK
jgi:hypothetical protein